MVVFYVTVIRVSEAGCIFNHLVFVVFAGIFMIKPFWVRPTQQTQNICITFVQRQPNVSDVDPTLYKCYTNVLGMPY